MKTETFEEINALVKEARQHLRNLCICIAVLEKKHNIRAIVTSDLTLDVKIKL